MDTAVLSVECSQRIGHESNAGLECHSQKRGSGELYSLSRSFELSLFQPKASPSISRKDRKTRRNTSFSRNKRPSNFVRGRTVTGSSLPVEVGERTEVVER
jgi:hypothetical protein